MKRVLFALLVLASLLGVASVGIVQAADFTAWAGIWFKGTGVSETGFKAPVLPTGGNVTPDNERLHDIFVQVVSCDVTATPAACSFNVCTLTDPSTETWTLSTDITVPIIAGNPLDFLTLLDYYAEASGVTEHFVVPLRVKGNVTKSAPGIIKSAYFTTLGGYHEKTYNEPVTDMSIGLVKFRGTMIPASSKQIAQIPIACTVK